MNLVSGHARPDESVLVFDVSSKAARRKAQTQPQNTDHAAFFAVEVARVARVLEFSGTEPVPLAPEWVRGIVNQQGRIVTIVDPATFLGWQAQSSAAERAVMLHVSRRSKSSMALQVGAVRGVVPRRSLGPLTGEGGPCVQWAGMLSERPVHVIDLDRLIVQLLADFSPGPVIASGEGVAS